MGPKRAQIGCRLRGCDWQYRHVGCEIVQECGRGCGRAQRGVLRRRTDAARLAAYLTNVARNRRARWAAPWRWLVDGAAT
jgi:hypothetical protein